MKKFKVMTLAMCLLTIFSCQTKQGTGALIGTGDGAIIRRRGASHQQASEEYFNEGELIREVVVSKMEITTQHGAIEDKTQTYCV